MSLDSCIQSDGCKLNEGSIGARRLGLDEIMLSLCGTLNEETVWLSRRLWRFRAKPPEAKELSAQCSAWVGHLIREGQGGCLPVANISDLSGFRCYKSTVHKRLMRAIGTLRQGA